jgi:hypothetical protein
MGPGLPHMRALRARTLAWSVYCDSLMARIRTSVTTHDQRARQTKLYDG